MKFRIPSFIAIILIISGTVFGSTDSNIPEVNFYVGNSEDARKKAVEEEKFFFMNFHATWCMPCNWMDQTSYKDTEIINLLNEEFVAVRVDIDGSEGFNLKNKYDVRVLPTIMIFDHQGQLVERIEETLTPLQLKEVLDSYVSIKDGSLTEYHFNRSPRKKAHGTKSPNHNVNGNTSLQKNIGFKLQVGVFASYQNALKLSEKLQTKFQEPVSIENDLRKKKILFKVVLGQFINIKEAENYREKLKTHYQLESLII